MAKSISARYRLATSAVQFCGTRTTTTPAHGGPPKVAFDARATVLTRADVQGDPLLLAIEEGHLEDTTLLLGFTPDGRLTSSTLDTTGQGAVVVGAVATVVGEVAGAAAPFLLKHFAVADPEAAASRRLAAVEKALRLVAAQRDRLT